LQEKEHFEHYLSLYVEKVSKKAENQAEAFATEVRIRPSGSRSIATD
jgi:hypothetical protein